MNNIIYQTIFKELLDGRIKYLKKLQKEHNLFLDLEEDKVRKKYCRTYSSDDCFANFMYMLCDMTSENNINNEIVVKEIQKSIHLNKIAEKGMFQYNQFLEHMSELKKYQKEHKRFLDLEDEDVIKKYCENYPNGTTDSLVFLLMVCSMTKDKDIERVQSLMIDKHMSELKKYQKEHKLFLDLEDEDVKKKFWEYYPEGGDSLVFLLMICNMTKDKKYIKIK